MFFPTNLKNTEIFVLILASLHPKHVYVMIIEAMGSMKNSLNYFEMISLDLQNASGCDGVNSGIFLDKEMHHLA